RPARPAGRTSARSGARAVRRWSRECRSRSRVVLQVSFEAVEGSLPQTSIRSQPGVDLGQRLRPEPIQAELGASPHVDESRLAEDPEVLGDGGLAHPQLGDQLAHRPLSIAEQVEDLTSGRFGDDRKGHPLSMPYQLYNRQGIDQAPALRRRAAIRAMAASHPASNGTPGSSRSTTTGAWSDGVGFPFRASRSISAHTTRSATTCVTYNRSIRIPSLRWNIPAR